MKRILLVYLPFCTPASPPYSITYLYSFLKNNCEYEIDVLDLNLEFHNLKFPKYQRYYKDPSDWKDYDSVTEEYHQLTKKAYSVNNRKVVDGKKPELFDEFLAKIRKKKPDLVAFSLVYSSQAFYAYALLKELKEITTIIGGPAVNEKLIPLAGKHLNNEIEFLDLIKNSKIPHEKLNFDFSLDFSIFPIKDYFTPSPVIPLKTSTTCYYKKCTYCSHFSNIHYHELDLDLIKKTVIESKQKYFFLIDDMISKKRLLKLAEVFKPLKINWTCQLKPTADLDLETFRTLRESGLTMLMWGVESGNDRILKLINKGTNRKDIEKVLADSHNAGIKNIAYMLFGFPTETKEEFLETIDFLKMNEKNIDLVSPSLFGLQKNTVICNNPSDFGITKIIKKERTVLEPSLTYEVSSGLSPEAALKLRRNYQKTIESFNKYPKTMNFFREHMFCLV